MFAVTTFEGKGDAQTKITISTVGDFFLIAPFPDHCLLLHFRL